MHRRFGDVLDHNRNIVVPHSNGLVIRCGNESTVVVDEIDGIDRSEMLIVFLSNFSRVHVILRVR